MERVAIYARVSTDEQAERQTIDNQLLACREHCASKGLEVVAEFKDDGVSGTVAFTDRPAGASLLAAAEQGSFTQVVTYRLDRLARDALQCLLALQRFKSLGVRVESVNETFDDSPSGTFTRTVMSAVAELERDLIVQRTSAGRYRRVREGKHQAAYPAYGYSYDREAGTLSVDPQQASVVQRMFKWSSEGASVKEIARRLESEGVKPPGEELTGRKSKWGWYAVTVRRLLRNPRYVGRGHYGTEPMAYPALVSEELFAAVQKGLTERRYRSAGNTRRYYPLQGLLYCGHCGTRYGARTVMRGHKAVAIYACQQRATYGKDKAGHDGVKWCWHTEELEGRMRPYALGLLLDPERLLADAQFLAQEARTALAGCEEQRAELEAKLAELENEERNTLRAHRKGLIDDAQLAVELSEVKTERQQLKRGLAGLDEAASESIDRAETAVAWMQENTTLAQLTEELRELLPDTLSTASVAAYMERLPDGAREVFDRLLWVTLRTFTKRITVREDGTLLVEGVLAAIEEPTSR